MRYLPIIATFLILVTGCKNSGSRKAVPVSDVHEVKVEEVLQANNYTYLRVSEKGMEQWLAVPSMIASKGDVYYYRGGMEMQNFQSSDLGKVFESVLFLEQVYTTPPLPEIEEATAAKTHTGLVKAKKMDFSVDPAQDGITIAELFAGKEKYEGKTVKVRGAVTRFNPSILETNWIHIQDGTEHEGQFDLAVTTDQTVEPGDIIIVEGKISLNKDFGYGYYYDVLMENATVSED
jgi:hypothetical protein